MYSHHKYVQYIICYGGVAVCEVSHDLYRHARASERDDRGDIITHNIILYNNIIYIFSLQETEEPHSSKPRYSTPILMAAAAVL